MVNAAHNLLDPTHLALDELRRGVEVAGLREQIVGRVDAISTRLRCILDLGGVGQEAVLHAAITLGVSNDRLHVVVADDILFLLLGVLVEQIVFHCGFLLIFVVFGIFVAMLHHLSNDRIHGSLLLFSERV